MYSRCRKCGRKLTDPESRARGFGPECWQSIKGTQPADADPDEHEPIEGQISLFDYVMEGIEREDQNYMPDMQGRIQ